MKSKRRTGLRIMWLVAALAALRGCYSEGSPTRAVARVDSPPVTQTKRDAGIDSSTSSFPPFDAGQPSQMPPSLDAAPAGACSPAQTMEPVPARNAVVASDAGTTSATLFVSDLFERFKGACGQCHVSDSQGNFHVAASTFSTDMTDKVLPRIFSNDPDMVMPPDTPPANTRDAQTDKYLKLGAQLQAWYDQGKPPFLYLPPAGANGASTNDYRMSRAVGQALTNLGNCIPSVELLSINAGVEKDLDAFFASAKALPTRLEQTDLTTLDSETLAQTGVVAYAPTYPLWSDNARKIRHVRVPKGKPIVFDKTTQQFTIPDNTRFYKTFLKKVIQKDGQERYRKVETRLIVSRTPTTDAQGDDQQTALFGTYAWNDDETEAVLVDDPLRNEQPFRDRLITLIADEAKYDQIVAAYAVPGTGTGNVSLTVALQKAGATRHYAIPGSQRCIQCHMGSPTRSFNLGFTPLQVKRRPLGVGGVIEEPGPDDLTQLQRLIDYGVISGMTSPDDVLPLERAEGDRAPRNDYELIAQGYMVGNCAHCHNPLGFPSVNNKATLQNTLIFLPAAKPGWGIFQFPLEQFSPRITRDLPKVDSSPVQIPYITPSLVDYPGIADFNHTVSHTESGPTNGNPVPYLPDYMVIAPWRSLIFRNVDTPFAYAADLALFPHMPMNVPGYDCRITQIMGDWMVSIPSVLKHPGDESIVQSDGYSSATKTYTNTDPNNVGNHANTDEQPYKEVLPSDPAYKDAVLGAEIRLEKFRGSGRSYLQGNPLRTTGFTGADYSRYGYCPDTTDIVDYTVTDKDNNHLVPADVKIYQKDDNTYRVPVDYTISNVGVYTEDATQLPSTARLSWPSEGVPDRPHWVITDSTDTPGPWSPRRSDWKDILGAHKYDALSATEHGEDLLDVTKNVIEVLHPLDPSAPGILLKDIADFATNDFPYGLWKPKTGCEQKLATKPKLASYAGAQRLRWMDKPDPTTHVARDPSSAVYTELPGAAIYNMLCINCHGPQADSHGRQADTLELMTGGDARVANFRDGLFGPTTDPGANLASVFAPAEWDAGVGPAGAEDWAARYMAFMALGGTSKLIPKAILNVVATTPVLGTVRRIPGVDSANMLGPIQTLCSQLFGMGFFADKRGLDPTSAQASASQVDFVPSRSDYPIRTLVWDRTLFLSQFSAKLLDDVGDAELLARMCSMNNPPPIRMLAVAGENVGIRFGDVNTLAKTAAVGTDTGTIETGISATNLMPWCIEGASSEFLATPEGKDMPVCPDSLRPLIWDDLWRWSSRGAINAGLSVFEYLKWLKIEKHDPVPPYDACEQL